MGDQESEECDPVEPLVDGDVLVSRMQRATLRIGDLERIEAVHVLADRGEMPCITGAELT
jgi:hypothetical protein